jgi:hypothetical protein
MPACQLFSNAHVAKQACVLCRNFHCEMPLLSVNMPTKRVLNDLNRAVQTAVLTIQ